MWAWLKKVVSRFQCVELTTRIRLVDEQVIIDRASLDSPLSFSWSDVDEIRTFKLDLLTTDDIRLAFQVQDMWHELSERDDGFIPLTEAMEARFPMVRQNWYTEAMQPPFATNQRTLWARG